MRTKADPLGKAAERVLHRAVSLDYLTLTARLLDLGPPPEGVHPDMTFRAEMFGLTPAERAGEAEGARLEDRHDGARKPGIGGKRLADWLIAGLAPHGYAVVDRGPQDWGHLVRFAPRDGLALSLRCQTDALTGHRVGIRPNVRRRPHPQADIPDWRADLHDRITALLWDEDRVRDLDTYAWRAVSQD